MAGTSSSSSSSSCVSFGSFDDVYAVKPPAPAATNGVKFLCSYGGKILPRHHDGQLRYVGGDTRVLNVHCSLRFSELHRKLRELCGWGAVSVRCQLPTGDLDALVSVTSDDDLANLLEEYDAAAASQERPQQLKIRAFLLPPGGPRTPRAASASPPSTPPVAGHHRLGHHLMHASRAGPPRAMRCVHQVAAPARLAARGAASPVSRAATRTIASSSSSSSASSTAVATGNYLIRRNWSPEDSTDQASLEQSEGKELKLKRKHRVSSSPR